MGNVSGRIEDGATLYLRDQSRFSIASLEITNGSGKVLLRITPNAYPCSKVVAKKDASDEGLVEFVQDPDPASQTPLLLRLSNEDELYLRFTFTIRRREEAAGTAPTDTNIQGLTFITAANSRDLDNLVTREFHADPNLHKNPSVFLMGDFSTEGHQSVQFDWKWPWRPPQNAEERAGGWRNTCSFVEYDQRAHKLSTLVQFSFWVQNSPQWPSPSIGASPEMNLSPPPKLRLPSSGGKSPYLNSNDDMELPSPVIDKFDGSTLGPSMTSLPAVKVDNCPRPAADNALGEDGPLFRATLKSLEQKTSSLRAKMKKVLKKAENARNAQHACNEAMAGLLEALREASTQGSTSGIQPALDHYFDLSFKDMMIYESQNSYNLQKLIIEPLTKLYVYDLKQAETKKREFEDESREYYSYVSRYLGIRNDSSKEKKKASSENKYQIKRRDFELKRFDYSHFMQDLHGGRKEQEVLSQLTMFADAQARGFLEAARKVQDHLPELEALDREVKDTAKEFQMQRTEREERRRLLEKSNTTYVEPETIPNFLPPATPNVTTQSSSEILGHHIGFERLGPGTSSVRAASSGSDGYNANQPRPFGLGLASSSASANVNDSSKPLEPESERKKEGLLWALSRPGSHADPKGLNKQAWHKYWIVLAGGQLCEYTNWKQKLGLHNDPINLRMASVREARNSDRRFCFEVVTPQYKRVYQATSEEDMNSWITAINNAVKSTIEGSASVRNFDPTKMMENHDQEPAQLKNISSALTGKVPHHHYSVHGQNPLSHGASNQAAANNVYRRTTVGARPAIPRRASSGFGDNPEKLLQMIREADPQNSSCADCGSQLKAEWVSINLGIVLCIECSGLHRSLGTHISKVRSLTLDVTSFTPDLVELLSLLGNKRSNAVWESKLLQQKPTAGSSRETRLKFIVDKYDQRLMVAPLPMIYASPDEMLIEACTKNDVASGLHALALRANPNHVDRETGKPVIILALESADPPLPDSDIPTSPNQVSTFPLAELLFQNAGEVPEMLKAGITDLLSIGAKDYLAVKMAKRMNQMASGAPLTKGMSVGGGGTTAMGSSGGVGGIGGNLNSLKERRTLEMEKLQKRMSSGARQLHRDRDR